MHIWNYEHNKKNSSYVNRKDEQDLVKLQLKSILKDVSPEGYYDDRISTGIRVLFKEEAFYTEKDEISITYDTFKKCLFDFI